MMALKRRPATVLLCLLLAGMPGAWADPGRFPPDERREMRQQMRDHWHQPGRNDREAWQNDRRDDLEWEARRQMRQELRQELREHRRDDVYWREDRGQRRHRGRD